MDEIIAKLYSKDTKSACGYAKKMEEESNKSNCMYKYYNDFIDMVDSNNSYVRNRGFALIGANVKWDTEDITNRNIERILVHVEDEKPITTRQCLKALKEVARCKEELGEVIKERILKLDYSIYPDSMQSLIFKDAQEVLKVIL